MAGETGAGVVPPVGAAAAACVEAGAGGRTAESGCGAMAGRAAAAPSSAGIDSLAGTSSKAHQHALSGGLVAVAGFQADIFTYTERPPGEMRMYFDGGELADFAGWRIVAYEEVGWKLDFGSCISGCESSNQIHAFITSIFVLCNSLQRVLRLLHCML